MRPDLIGKTIVGILDHRSHANGLIPPSAYMGEIVAAEADYAAIRHLGTERGLIRSKLYKPSTWPIDPDYDLFEPGDRLETYLPGYSAIFGTPDFVYFQGSAREKWERDHATPTGS